MLKIRTILITILLVIMGTAPILASGVPALPAAYWGSVSLADGSPVAQGTVEAVIDNAVCGSLSITDGTFGAPGPGLKLAVQGENLEGKVIQFRVKTQGEEVWADQTAVWTSGAISSIDLTINLSSGAAGSQTPVSNSQSPSSNYSSGSGGNISTPNSSASAVTPVVQSQSTPETAIQFSDVPDSHWAYQDIQLLAKSGIIKGVSETDFAPASKVTRAQFAAMLVRALQLPETAAAGGQFSDVETGTWYSSAVSIAYNNGLIKGITDKNFAPHQEISREQMAVMLIRALENRKISLAPQTSTAVPQLLDWQQVSSWAKAECQTALQAGLICGYADGTLGPGKIASRAEAATMLKRFMVYARLLEVTEIK